MISASNISLSFARQLLFKDVNIKFTPGNCYGIIGANGAGKSTFLKILSGEITPDTGEINISAGERMAVLKQDQNQFDSFSVLHTVIMGHKRLYDVMIERETLYEKENFSDEDGLRVSDLETEFAELGGWEAESEAGILLSGLGLSEDFFEKTMETLEGGEKVRVLLAQALFGNPDILLLDEPTNNLDLESVAWLEEFLFQFKNTVIVVSHDRHFLNKVCTHVADIDFGKISLFVGNYDFWFHASQLARKQERDQKKRREDKIAELQEFIQRFSSNAARSRQATSRQKLVEKLSLDDIKPSSRKAPYVGFDPERECGKKILVVEDLSKTLEGQQIIARFSLLVEPGDKIALVGPYHHKKTVLFQLLTGELPADSGKIEWGTTIKTAYFPKDNTGCFNGDITLIEWLRQFSDVEEESYVRGFLGRMLFSGDESLKKVKVLSGGEKVRCLLAKLMLSRANTLILDEPTNHLDLEAITALNDGLIDFSGCLLFTSHDHQFVDSIANRILEFTPQGIIDRRMRFDDYLVNEDVKKIRNAHYQGRHLLEI